MQRADARPVARAIEKMIRSRPNRQGRSASLEPVLERLALGLCRSVRRLAGTEGRVALQATSAPRFSEYRDGIQAASLLAVFEIEDAGPGLLVLDPRLTDASIELLLGGEQLPGSETATPRAYTPADQAVVRGLMRLIVAEFACALVGSDAATVALTGRLLRTETDPQFVAIGAADSPVAVARFEATLGPGGCGGTFDLVLPDPFLEFLGRTPPQPGPVAPGEPVLPQGRMGAISGVSFALHAVVDRLRVPLLDLARWETGTWIPLAADAEQPVTIYCERDDRSGLGRALFAGRLGSSRGRRAVRVADVIDATLQAHDRQGSAST